MKKTSPFRALSNSFNSRERNRAVTHPFEPSATARSSKAQSDALLDADSEFESRIIHLTKQLEEKENVIETSAMIGKQLISQNDALQDQVNELTKEINAKDSLLIEQERKIVILQDQSLHFETEANTLHKDLITANQEIERLKDEIIFLEKLQSQKSTIKPDLLEQTPTNNDKTQAVERLSNEKNVLEQCLKDEQNKFQAMLQKAEEKSRDNLKVKRISARLEAINRQLVDERKELQFKYADEIHKYKERISNLEFDNEELLSQLTEQQDCLNVAQEEINSLRSNSATAEDDNVGFRRLGSKLRFSASVNTYEDANNLEFMEHLIDTAVSARTSRSATVDINDGIDVNPASREMSQEPLQRHANVPKDTSAQETEQTLNTSNIQHTPEPLKNDNKPPDSANSAKSGKSPPSSAPSIQFDAMEEYIRLSVLAAKIKFKDVTISSKKVRKLISDNNVEFHEVSDWLRDYMIHQRRKQESPPRMPQPQESPAEKTKRIFQRLFDKTRAFVTGDSNQEIVLQVCYRKRRFEVSMKEKDTLQAIAYCLPMFVGRQVTSDDFAFVYGTTVLQSDKSIHFNGIKSGSSVRIVHKKQVQSYLKKVQNRRRASVSESVQAKN